MPLGGIFAFAAFALSMSSNLGAADSCSQNSCSTRLTGVVSSGAERGAVPVARAKIKIFRAGSGAPVLLAETVSNARG